MEPHHNKTLTQIVKEIRNTQPIKDKIINVQRDIKTLLLERAKEWYGLGYNVIPVEGKIPKFTEWNKYFEERIEDYEFKYWLNHEWSALKPKNLGVICCFNNLIAYDIDGDKYIPIIENAYKSVFGKYPHEDTYVEITKNGVRLFFRIKDEIKDKNNKTLIKEEGHREITRCVKKMVVVAPSIHPDSTDGEVWGYVPAVKGTSPKDIKEVLWDDILKFEKIIENVKKDKEELESTEFTEEKDRIEFSSDKLAEELYDVLKKYWKVGRRYYLCMALSYFLVVYTKLNYESLERLFKNIIKKFDDVTEKDLKEFLNTLKYTYKHYYSKDKQIAYRTHLLDAGFSEEEIEEFKRDILKVLKSNLRSVCTYKFRTNVYKTLATEFEGTNFKFTVSKLHNKIKLTVVNLDTKRTVFQTVKHPEKFEEFDFYTKLCKKMNISEEHADKLFDLIIDLIEQLEKDVKRRMFKEMEKSIEDLNEILKSNNLQTINRYELESLFIIDEKGNIKLSESKFADLIQRKIPCVVLRDNGDLLVYLNGRYYQNDEYMIIETVIEYIGRAISYISGDELSIDDITNNFVKEVIGHIVRGAKKVSITDFNDYSRYINVKNGILDMDTGELLPHSPEFLFTFQLPIEYNPDAKCPKIENFINTLTYERDRILLWKIIAYTLIPKQPEQCWFILVGEGSNGKSTYLNLIQKFLGDENVSNIPLQALEKEKFARYVLVGKLANIFADLPKEALDTTGIIKSITGGDAIYIEKKYKQGFSYYPDAKLIFSANELPQVSDISEGFWRRVILIEFPFKFKKNPKLLDEISQPEELSGLLNLALKYRKLILEEGIDRKTEIKLKWMRKSEPVKYFVVECIEQDEDSVITKKELYDAFIEYCRENKIPHSYLGKVGYSLFFKKLYDVLDNFNISFKEQRSEINGERVYVIRGISLKKHITNDSSGYDDNDNNDKNEGDNKDDSSKTDENKEKINNLKMKILKIIEELASKDQKNGIIPYQLEEELESENIEIDPDKITDILKELEEEGEIFLINGRIFI